VSVEPGSYGSYDFQPFFHKAFLNHEGTDRILDTRPGFFAVGSGYYRRGAGERTYKHSPFLLYRVEPAWVEVIAHIGQIIVSVDRFESRACFPGFEYSAKAAEIRVPLGKHLIRRASFSELVFYLFVLIVPI
jgi:hypothetical protein